jgi:glycosyltransferase involved in cell wall biosynthesis
MTSDSSLPFQMSHDNPIALIRITWDYNDALGGAQTAANVLDQELATNFAYKPILIAGKLSSTPPSFYEVICQPMLFSAFGFSLSIFETINRIRSRYPRSILIIDGLWSFSSIIGAYFFLKGLYVFQFVHGHLDPYYRGNKIKYIYKLIYWHILEKHLLKYRSNIIFTTKQEFSKAAPWLKNVSFRYAIEPLGLSNPPASISPSSLKLPGHKRVSPETISVDPSSYFLSLGRIHPKKGLDILIQAYSLAFSLLPSLPNLLICGPIESPAYFGQLVSQIQSRSLSGKVFFLQPVYSTLAKYQLYLGACFTVLCTRGENFGMVVPESLSVGTPVITTYNCDLCELLATSNSGLVVYPEPESFSQALLSAANIGPEQYSSMRQSSLVAFSVNLSISGAAKRFHRLFSSNLSDNI